MRKLKKGFILTVAALVLIAGFFVAGGIVFKGDFKLFGRKTTISGDVIKQQISEISELAVLRFHYTDAGKFDDPITLKEWKVPLTTKYFILMFSGEIKLGIDFKDIVVAVNEVNREIEIALPPVRIISHAVDENSKDTLAESKNILNQIKTEDVNTYLKERIKYVEENYITEALLTEAAEIAKRQIGAFVGNFAGVKGEYTVVFV